MPELPEVETVARQLAPLLVGRRIVALGLLDPRLWELEPADVVGCYIHEVCRIGKEVGLGLSVDRLQPLTDFWLLVHLRMTGRLVHVPPSVESERGEHVRAGFRFDDGSRLLFDDPRRFGTFRLALPEAPQSTPGIDPLGPRFTAEALAERLAKSRSPIKTWLLRQDGIVGLGNIYASEILFRAKIHPDTPAHAIVGPQAVTLRNETVAVLKDAIDHCGTTFSDFQNAHGEGGGFQNFLNVYDREGKPCRVCARPIVKTVHGGRSTYFCRHCQPKPKRRGFPKGSRKATSVAQGSAAESAVRLPQTKKIRSAKPKLQPRKTKR